MPTWINTMLNIDSMLNKLNDMISVNESILEELTPVSNKSYRAASSIEPSLLAIGADYFCIRNTHATKKLKIKNVNLSTFFAGLLSLTSVSQYSLTKYTWVTSTTGTAISVVPWETENATSIAEVKILNSWLTLTGWVDVGSIVRFLNTNNLAVSNVLDNDFRNEPLVLWQNECLVVRSQSPIALGSWLSISLDRIEE